ncbi:hypothetical protein Tco_0375606 [Tanacetum coccineum]
MGDENPIRTLGDYSKPSHEGYRNTIELPVGNNMVPLRSNTIWLVQNGCSFHGLRSEDPNQHLKDFLKLVDSLDLDGENKERTCLPKGGEERSDKMDEVLDNTIKPIVTETEISVKEDKGNNETKIKPVKRAEKKEVEELLSSRPVEYYLKHKINEKLIEGLVDNNRFVRMSPALEPSKREDPSVKRVNGYGISSSVVIHVGGVFSSGLSAMKSAKIWPRMDVLGM